jgi:hypothetical protein
MLDQTGARTKSEGLGAELEAKMAPLVERVHERVDRALAAAEELATEDHRRDLEMAANNLRRVDVQIGFIGPTSAGKSTLLNCTALTTVGTDLLPTGGGATSALSTDLLHGPERRSFIIRRSGIREEVSQEEARSLRLETADGIALLLRPKGSMGPEDEARRVVLEGVLPRGFAGVTLSDSRGTFDGGGGTENALAAAQHWHAAVLVERDQAGGVGRDSMLRLVRQAVPPGKELFVVINQEYSDPPDEGYQADIFQTYVHGLGRGPRWSRGTRLEDHGIFFVNALEGLEARRVGDEAAAEASGVPAFERALAERVVQARWHFTSRPWLLQLRDITVELRSAVERKLDDLRARKAEVPVILVAELAEIDRALEGLDRARGHVKSLVEGVVAQAEREFNDVIIGCHEQVAKDLETAILDNASGWNVVGLVRAKNRKALTDEIRKIIEKSIQTRVEEWTCDPTQLTRVIQVKVNASLEAVVQEAASVQQLLDRPLLEKRVARDAEAAAQQLQELRTEWQAKVATAHGVDADKLGAALPSGVSILGGAVIGGAVAAAIAGALAHALASALGVKIKAALAAALAKATFMKGLMTKLAAVVGGAVISGPVGWAIIAAGVVLGSAWGASKLQGEIKKAAKDAFAQHAAALGGGLWKEVEPIVRGELRKTGASMDAILDERKQKLGQRCEAAKAGAKVKIAALTVEIDRRSEAHATLGDVVSEYAEDLRNPSPDETAQPAA